MPIRFLIRTVILAGLSVLFWRNRFRIQKFLESQGVRTPLLKGNVGEVVRSGVARVAGQAQNELGGEGVRAPKAASGR